MKKITAILLAAVLLLSVAAFGPARVNAFADEADIAWPERDITLIVPSGAGGTMDLAARLVATKLAEILGVNVIVENISGAGLWNGWLATLNAPRDGYTFCVYQCASLAVARYNEANPHSEGPEDFIKLINHVADVNALAIRVNDDRFNDLDSFIAYAQENLVLCTSGSVGLGNGNATDAEYFNKNFGTNISILPVDGEADGMARFYAGDTDCFFGSVGDFLSDYDEGIYKVLCLFGEERSPLMPDVPLLSELIDSDYTAMSCRGFAFPAGVDQAIVDKMTAALIEAAEAVEEDCLKIGLQTFIRTGEEYEELEMSQLLNRLNVYGLTLDDKIA